MQESCGTCCLASAPPAFHPSPSLYSLTLAGSGGAAPLQPTQGCQPGGRKRWRLPNCHSCKVMELFVHHATSQGYLQGLYCCTHAAPKQAAAAIISPQHWVLFRLILGSLGYACLITVHPVNLWAPRCDAPCRTPLQRAGPPHLGVPSRKSRSWHQLMCARPRHRCIPPHGQRQRVDEARLAVIGGCAG